jgi:hypothetical protein
LLGLLPFAGSTFFLEGDDGDGCDDGCDDGGDDDGREGGGEGWRSMRDGGVGRGW